METGIWSVAQEDGRIYFKYRDNYMGQFTGLLENAEYMVTCINAGISAYVAIKKAVDDEVDPVIPLSIIERSDRSIKLFGFDIWDRNADTSIYPIENKVWVWINGPGDPHWETVGMGAKL